MRINYQESVSLLDSIVGNFYRDGCSRVASTLEEIR